MRECSRRSIAFDRIPADRYDETRGGDERGDDFAADLARHLVPGTVLEAGVGTGIVAGGLARAGRTVFGVDLALPMLAKARGRLDGRVAAGDATALPVASGAVDNVLFCWVLHLVGDVAGAFAEAARVVRPGGRVVAFYGRAIFSPTDLDPALAPLTPLTANLHPTAEEVDAAAAAAALRLVADDLTTARERAVSPAELADNVEQRTWSYLWNCGDEQWDAHVAPTLRLLRALPEPERPRSATFRDPFRVYERTG
jgi:SAM-dependent methyltransferase